MKGWIKLHRVLLKSRVFANEGLLKVWMYCLLKANHEDNYVNISTGRGQTEVKVKAGQFIYGRNSAAKKLNMNPSTVKKRMDKLKNIGNLDIQSNTHYSLISICNWDSYQQLEDDEEPPKEQAGNNQVTAKEQPCNTDKNEKNDKNEKKSPPISPRPSEATQSTNGIRENSVADVGIAFKCSGKIDREMVDHILEAYSYSGRIGNEASNRKEVGQAIRRVAQEKGITLQDATLWLRDRAVLFAASDAGQRGGRFTPRASTWFRDRCYRQDADTWKLSVPDKSGADPDLMTWDEAYEAGYQKEGLEVVKREKDQFGRPKVRPKKQIT